MSTCQETFFILIQVIVKMTKLMLLSIDSAQRDIGVKMNGVYLEKVSANMVLACEFGYRRQSSEAKTKTRLAMEKLHLESKRAENK